jgi:hypothetical protein
MIAVGPVGHTGSKGYFSETSHLKNGQSFLDRSVEVISQVLQNLDDAALPNAKQISSNTSPAQE